MIIRNILIFPSEVDQSRTAQIHAFSLIGNGTTIGNHSVISNSVIGQSCTIGRNVSIQGSYIWDNVIIEDDCKLSHALVCDGVHLRAGVVLEPGVILSFKVHNLSVTNFMLQAKEAFFYLQNVALLLYRANYIYVTGFIESHGLYLTFNFFFMN